MAILTRKSQRTNPAYPNVAITCEISAHDSARLTHDEAPRLADRHVIDGTPEVGIVLRIDGIGTLYLTPIEARALVECRDRVLGLAKNGGNFAARSVKFSR